MDHQISRGKAIGTEESEATEEGAEETEKERKRRGNGREDDEEEEEEVNIPFGQGCDSCCGGTQLLLRGR